MTLDRTQVGSIGERLCISKLIKFGWTVEDLNFAKANHPNSDLKIAKGNISLYVQVKASAKMASRGRGGDVTAGSVSPALFNGASIFNRSTKGPPCEFVVFLSEILAKPRYFVLPVDNAEKLFRRNIDFYFLSPKLNGGVKSLKGQADIFVGNGAFPHARIVPDQRAEILVFEEGWDHLVG